MNDDDVEVKGYGSLGGEGVEHLNSVKSSVAAEGVQNKMRCGRCGKGLLVTIPWSELIWMGKRMPPVNGSWRYEGFSGTFMPNITCTCGEPVALGITPDECVRHLRAGEHAGKITGAQVAQYSQQIDQQTGRAQPR